MRRVCVFSHPNHEAAVHGLVRRWQPGLVFLTDGGGADRVADTRDGLQRLGHAGATVFLDRTEASVYDALVRRDLDYFHALADDVRAALDELAPDEVACDAIEYYNPVHDMALPLVRRALRGRPHVRVREIPLIHEEAARPGRYRVQQAPPSRSADLWVTALTAEEAEAKREARREGYSVLMAQLGNLCDACPSLYEREQLIAAAAALPSRPPSDVSLRYDRRGRLLVEQGRVVTAITHDDHWLPLARALVEA